MPILAVLRLCNAGMGAFMFQRKYIFYELMCFFAGMVFYAPVSLLVRTQAGVSLSQFFLLQAVLSGTTFAFEIPCGYLTDRIGCRRTMMLAQGVFILCRILLLCAFFMRSYPVFLLEAVLEGISFALTSGTESAYLYGICPQNEYLTVTARTANFGTAGFLIATILYLPLYRLCGISGLLTASVVSAVLAFLGSAAMLPEQKYDRAEPHTSGSLRGLIHLPAAWALAALSACLTLGFLLINFFYALRLQDCGIDVSMLTPIILGYSVVQMLGEPLIALMERKLRRSPMLILLAVCAVCIGVFGILRSVPAVLSLMLLLPLLLDLPGCYLSEIENHLVDAIGGEERRAAMLSALNMGSSLLEVLALFASALIAGIGLPLCFFLLGILLAASGVILHVLQMEK